MAQHRNEMQILKNLEEAKELSLEHLYQSSKSKEEKSKLALGDGQGLDSSEEEEGNEPDPNALEIY